MMNTEKKVYKLHWRNRVFHLSISTKTIISYLVVLFIPIIGIFTVNTNMVKSFLTEDYLNKLESEIPAIFNILGETPEQMKFIFGHLTTHAEFRKHLDNRDFGFIRYTLADIQKSIPTAHALLLLDKSGQVMATAHGDPGGFLNLGLLLHTSINQKSTLYSYEKINYDAINQLIADRQRSFSTALVQVVLHPVYSLGEAYVLAGVVVLNEAPYVPDKIHDLFSYDTAIYLHQLDGKRIVSTTSRVKNIWTLYDDLPRAIAEQHLAGNTFSTMVEIESRQAATATASFASVTGEIIGGITIAEGTEQINAILDEFKRYILIFTVGTMVLIAFIGGIVHHDTTAPLSTLKSAMADVASGKLDVRVDFKTFDDFEDLGSHFNNMVENIEDYTIRINRYNKLNEIIITTLETEKVLYRALEKLIEYSNSQVGLVYLHDKETNMLNPTVGVNIKVDSVEPLKIGEGLIGKVAADRTYFCLSGINPEHLVLDAGLVSIAPKEITAFPIVYKNNLIGVLALGSLTPHEKEELDIINAMINQIAIVVDNTITHRKVEELSVKDELTDTYNRRYVFDLLKKELIRARRYSYPMSVAIIDLDDFKKINDTHGHIVGDKVLKAFASATESHLRNTDTLGRYGGEEFILLMPHTERKDAVETIERIQALIKAEVTQRTGINLTASIGVAAYPEHGTSAEAVVKTADDFMYEAKNTGKNKVVTHQNFTT